MVESMLGIGPQLCWNGTIKVPGSIFNHRCVRRINHYDALSGIVLQEGERVIVELDAKNRKILSVVIEEDCEVNIRQRMLQTKNSNMDEYTDLEYPSNQYQVKYEPGSFSKFPAHEEFYSTARAYF